MLTKSFVVKSLAVRGKLIVRFTESETRSIVPLQVLDVGLQFAETVVAFEDIEIFHQELLARRISRK